VNDTTSNVSVDLTRVKAALLATDSQQTRSSRITRTGNLPVSSWPPTNHTERLYGPARPKRQRRKLKIERINDKNVSKTQTIETAHLWNAHGAQPPDILSKWRNRVFGPIRLRARPKVERINISQMPRAETTHLARTHAMQPCGNPSKRFHRVYTPIRRHGQIKFAPTNVSPTRNGKMAHLGRNPIVQPHGDDPQRSHRVIGPRCRCGRLKIVPRNVSRKRKERKRLPRALQAHTPPPTRSVQSHAISIYRRSSIRPPELEEHPAKG